MGDGARSLGERILGSSPARTKHIPTKCVNKNYIYHKGAYVIKIAVSFIKRTAHRIETLTQIHSIIKNVSCNVLKYSLIGYLYRIYSEVDSDGQLTRLILYGPDARVITLHEVLEQSTRVIPRASFHVHVTRP